jgi:hypothetical protein
VSIEHGKIAGFLGNNSKTINKNRNLTWGKYDQHSKIYLSCNFADDGRQVMAIAHTGELKNNFNKCAFSFVSFTLKFISK